jgi:peptide/nickel transport system ATP-binding protein
MSAVEVRELCIGLAGTGTDVVGEIDLRIEPGEVVGLVGESGSGKTTVGMALLGHCRRGGQVWDGSVMIDGADLAQLSAGEVRRLRGGTVAYIPQDPGMALNPALRIGRQIAEVLDGDGAARVHEVLDEVALPSGDDFLRRYPHQLSGGQQQRVAIAMAFANRPHVIVCDEPTTGLDVTTQARVLETVRELCRAHGVAALYVSHDLAVVAELADRVAVMYGGRIVESGPREQIFTAPRHPYTRRLLLAVPDIAGKRAVVGIPGHAALPGSRPEGCSFHPRCLLATEECRREFPPVTRLDGSHEVRCHHHADSGAVPRPTAPAASSVAGTVPPPTVLAVRNLDAHHGAAHTLFDIDLEVRRNESVALVGESGSGKTTLARCVAGLHADYTGEVALHGTALPPPARKRSAEARKAIQYVFQNPYASLNPRRTVGQAIARQLQLFSATATVADCLEHVALSPAAADRYPDQLSGGERQHVAIARALAAEPALLVCDEVTSALDVSVQAAIVELLERLRAEMGLSLLFITHDLALIRTIADRVLVMTGGRIVEHGPVDTILGAPAADYTRRLLRNTPSIEVALGRAAAPTA